MTKTLKTKQLEFDKSSFLIDLILHDNSKLYVEVSQHILNDAKVKQTLKINPTIIPELVRVLEEFYAEIPDTKPIQRPIRKDFATQEDKDKIQARYLKGVSLRDLAMQFDTTQENIEMILRNNEIVVLSRKEENKIKWGNGRRHGRKR